MSDPIDLNNIAQCLAICIRCGYVYSNDVHFIEYRTVRRYESCDDGRMVYVIYRDSDSFRVAEVAIRHFKGDYVGVQPYDLLVSMQKLLERC